MELQASFSEVRILKNLEKKTKRGRGRGAEAPHVERAREEARREGKPGEEEGDWVDRDLDMAKGSTVSYYCQGLLLMEYHSNGTDGSSWLAGWMD